MACKHRLLGIKKTKSVVTKNTSHYKAREIKGAGKCDRCGEAGEHVHHKDRDPLNNDPENLERLCVECHIKEHKRARAICGVCGKPATRLGYCPKHYYRYARYGDPLKLGPKREHHKGREIVCPKTGQRFMSIGQASNLLGIERARLSRAIKAGKECNGVHLSYAE